MIWPILLAFSLGVVAAVLGWEYGPRVGDQRGIVGFVFGALVFATVLTMGYDW